VSRAAGFNEELEKEPVRPDLLLHDPIEHWRSNRALLQPSEEPSTYANVAVAATSAFVAKQYSPDPGYELPLVRCRTKFIQMTL
jgi:hypothetical protein